MCSVVLLRSLVAVARASARGECTCGGGGGGGATAVACCGDLAQFLPGCESPALRGLLALLDAPLSDAAALGLPRALEGAAAAAGGASVWALVTAFGAWVPWLCARAVAPDANSAAAADAAAAAAGRLVAGVGGSRAPADALRGAVSRALAAARGVLAHGSTVAGVVTWARTNAEYVRVFVRARFCVRA